MIEIASSKKRSRRRRKEQTNTSQEQATVATDESKKKTRKRRSRKRKQIDISALAMQYKDPIVELLGLDLLGLSDKVINQIVKDVMDAVITSTSYKPSLEVILKRIERHKKQLYKIVVYNILENIPAGKLTDQQLEFVINYGEEILIPYIDELYSTCLKRGRDDLVSLLQYIWEKHGRPSPVECPRCGFRSIMPDLSCLVCGYVVKEDYIRKKLDFDTKFREFIKNASVAELREILDLGFVLLSETDVKNPKERFDPTFEFYYQIYLKPKDTSLILEEISNRKLPI